MKEHPLLDVKEDKYFKLHMGTELKSLEELKDALKTMSDETFNYHVTSERNDFAGWIRDVMKDKRLADDLEKIKTKEEALQRVSDRIRWLREELSSSAPYLHMTSRIKEYVFGALTGLIVGLLIGKIVGLY